MEKDHLSRKLAVILHADVVGSTSLVQQNEILAHQRIQTVFHQFSETINSYGGITHELRGDALVAEFNRASDAVPAAIAFQALNEEANNALDDDLRPQLRIGISLGEVVVADNTITGAGVVLAQRLEQLATPGGVVTQGSVSETLPERMPFEFESLGEHVLKGFDQPVRAFIARLQPGKELPAPDVNATPLSAETVSPQVPDKPSIVVMPFNALGGDDDTGAFADGLSEDIITTLSIISSLFVISRHSSFVYREQAADVEAVARELGVRYVLVGTVRKAGNRLRVTVQLVDAEHAENIYADRFDRGISDLFQVQDDITREIVTALRLTLTDGEHARLWWRSTKNMDAWLSAMRGMNYVLRGSADENQRAREYFHRATQADPNYAFAMAWLAWTHYFDVRFGFSDSQTKSLGLAEQHARSALEIDPQIPHAHCVLGVVLAAQGQFRDAIDACETAILGSPNDAWLKACLARVLIFAGRAAPAEQLIRQAMRLNPFFPNYYLGILANALIDTGRADEAIEPLTTAVKRDPDYFAGHLRLASLYGLAGRASEAEAEAVEVLRINPRFDLSKAEGFLGPNNPALDQFIEGLRAAGLPVPKE